MTETFAIVPASSKGFLILGPVFALLLGVMLVMIITWRGSQAATFEVSPVGLRIRGDLWARSVPALALRVAEARVVSYATDPSLRPRARTKGTGLPGYSSGWFRLANGEKALLYVTDPSRLAYIPTTQGFSLLLSTAEPHRFVARIKEIGSK